MDWKLYVAEKTEEMYEELKMTVGPIECPHCGAPVYKNTSVILTSKPPQYEYFCKECGWSEFFF